MSCRDWYCLPISSTLTPRLDVEATRICLPECFPLVRIQKEPIGTTCDTIEDVNVNDGGIDVLLFVGAVAVVMSVVGGWWLVIISLARRVCEIARVEWPHYLCKCELHQFE